MRSFHISTAGIWRNVAGNTMVEFAIIAPAVIMVLIGGLYVGMLGFTMASMQYAVQAGARCASINTTTCTNSTTTETYTRSHFWGTTSAAPVFTSSTVACGHAVTGSLTFVFSTGLSSINVPLTSKACYP
jgi:Flp pilus assembly protein TadG